MKDMKYSEIKGLYDFLEGLDDTIDKRKVTEQFSEETEDFEVCGYRFIDMDEIDNIQCDELRDDEYTLGCFNAGFIAYVTDLNQSLIEAAQEGNAYEAVGQAILDGGHLEDVQKNYAKEDGYGYHFAYYDHEQYEYGNYFVFRVD